MLASKLTMMVALAVLLSNPIGQRAAFGLPHDDEEASELIQVIREFERGINTRDVDLAMSTWSHQASIQAGAASRKTMYSWEQYRQRLVNWVQVVKDLEHFNFREVKIEGNKASLMCDARLMAYSRQMDRWKPRTVLNVYYEFVQEDGKWHLLRRTY